MADLDTYRAKRDFRSTSEPAGARGKAKATKLSFVVQKHAATRLHYDLRLELDGVLKSWAVTRGPSLVPGEKRLAVHVEDHPIEYGSFEGQIAPGNYGAGEVIVWDKGEWIPQSDPHKGYAKGHLDFILEGEKLHGGWHLVRIRGRPGEKRENWLLIKAHDDAAREPGDPEIVDELPLSIISGRSVEDLAGGHPAGRGSASRAKRARPNRQFLLRTILPRNAESTRLLRQGCTGEGCSGQGNPAKAPVSGKDHYPRAVGDQSKSARPSTTTRKGSSRQEVFRCLISSRPVSPSYAARIPSSANYVHEIKFDGYRMQARIDHGRVALKTRTGLDWTAKFKGAGALDALSALPCVTALIDGELVVEAEIRRVRFLGAPKRHSRGPGGPDGVLRLRPAPSGWTGPDPGTAGLTQGGAGEASA